MEAQRISLSRIAQLAGTSPQNVSNWRRRMTGFPKPVAGTDRRPLFDLEEVEGWLKVNNRFTETPGLETMFLAVLDGLRSTMSPDKAIPVALGMLAWKKVAGQPSPACFSVGDQSETLPTSVAGLPESGDPLETVARLNHWAGSALRHPYSGMFAPLKRAAEEGQLHAAVVGWLYKWAPSEGFEISDVLDVVAGKSGRASTFERTPRPIRGLAVDLLDLREGSRVLDPACGSASFLIDACRSRLGIHAIGVDVSERSLETAALASFLSDVPLELWRGDTLYNDPVAGIRAEAIFMDPPFGLLYKHSIPTDSRWVYGVPRGRDLDLVWLQHALSALEEGGRAVVVLTASSAFSANGSRVRSEMLRAGVVEAIVGLPGGTYPSTQIPLALWLLRKLPSGPMSPSDDVLLIDASTGEKGVPEELSWIAQTVSHFRSGLPLTASKDRARRVPLLDIIAEDANLTPARWLTQSEPVSPFQLADALKTWESVSSGLAGQSPIRLRVEKGPVSRLKLQDLAAEKSLLLFHGRPVPEEFIRSKGGVPFLTPATLNPEASREQRFVDEAWSTEKGAELTMPGDIVVWGARTTIRAMVLREGGAYPSSHLQVVRLSAKGWDPDYVAASIESEHNRRFAVGSVLLRPKLRDFEIAALTLQEQILIGEQLRRLARTREQLDLARSALEELSELVTNAVGLGNARAD